MATMKEIAQICGVSRGTVDRVINRRGKVRPETERMILQAVERMGYTKSMLGRALSVKRSQPVIGVVMCSEGNPFLTMCMRGWPARRRSCCPTALRWSGAPCAATTWTASWP